MKNSFLLILVVAIIFLTAFQLGAEPIRVLYDDTHGQTAGNAEWTIGGAYSEMVDLLKANDFVIDSLKAVSANGRITDELLGQYQGLILAEPNNPYKKEEQQAIVEFVLAGGGAFIIADHGGADRDNDGYDAVIAINEFSSKLGFAFDGNFFYEAPVCGTLNQDHPANYGIRAVGAWAASTISPKEAPETSFTGLIFSRHKKAAYVAAIEAGKGRIIAIGDSSPFDDGIGTGKKKLHDSYDSFMYSHPQLAYNAMKWSCKQKIEKRIPLRKVSFAQEAKLANKAKNLLIDAAHGNAASDKMETFERHMRKFGLEVFYSVTTITPEMLEKFSIVILPNPSLRILDVENSALCDWLMGGGRLVLSGDWDSTKLGRIGSVNSLLTALGSVIRLNDDQVWDHTNKTNKPWGVLAHVFNPEHPITKDLRDNVIFWGTCSLLDRKNAPLTRSSGVEILVTGDDDSINKDGNKKNDAVIYPKGVPIPLMAVEKLANGILVVIGCSNYTEYQYPDSPINAAQTGTPSFTHITPDLHDNLIEFLIPEGRFSGSPSRH